MYSRIRRETSTLRKHWYLQGKTHIFSPRTHRRRMNLLLKTCCFFMWILGMRFRASFVHVGVKIEPNLAPRCPKMSPKMNQKWHQINSWSNNAPNRLQNTNLPPQRGPQGIHFEHLGCPKWPKFNILGAKSDPEGSLLRALVPQSVLKRPFGRPRHVFWRFLGF